MRQKDTGIFDCTDRSESDWLSPSDVEVVGGKSTKIDAEIDFSATLLLNDRSFHLLHERTASENVNK